MRKEKTILFGIDDSDFSRQALLEAAGLLKNSEDTHLTLFHGVSEPDFPLSSEQIDQGRDEAERLRESRASEARKVLAQAEETLVKSGFKQGRISTVLERKCNDPCRAMLKLAGDRGFDTIAVARWGKTTVSRQIIGSTVYHLSQLADNLALWVIDPRICSHDVLIGLVGAPVSDRILEYTLRYFSHLKESRFTFFHVIPPIPPQCWSAECLVDMEKQEKQEKIISWIKEYTDKVKKVANEAKQKLIEAGVPEKNVFLKLEPQKKGIARDFIVELEEGNHGILVIGRKGYKAIKEFGLGSKANKLLLNGRAFVICLVS